MSNSKDLTTFIREDLYPAIFSKLNEVFPEMHFKKVGSRSGEKWISPNYLNGSPTAGQQFRRDKTVVTSKRINRALEQGGGSKDLLTLYMDINNIPSAYEAAKEISKNLGIEFPENEQQRAEYEAKREKREIVEQSYERQKAALFKPEGAEALRYLKEDRGYSEELIRKMGLGYLSPEEGAFLEEKTKIGYYPSYKDYVLSIPFYSKGRLQGFKLRYVSEKAKQEHGKDKYRNTATLQVKNNPFALAPWNVKSGTKKERTLIAVEGELDALHAIAEGAENIIATAGGKITTEMALAIKAKGYNNVILTLDTDGAGQDFTEESIENLLSVGIGSYVATFPDAKDTDEYLSKHSIEDFNTVLSDCTQAIYFLFNREVARYNSSPRTAIDFDKFTDKVIELSLKTKDDVLRGRILDSLKDAFGISGEEAYKGYREKAERLKREQAKEAAVRKSDKALIDAITDLRNGRKAEAKKRAAEALEEIEAAEGEDKYSFLLKDNTDELWESYKNPPKTFDTAFYLSTYSKKNGEMKYRLSFPSGYISVIGAFTNHGKSKILQSIALDGLKADWEDGVILYFTYEENEQNVNKQFLNAYADLELTRKAKNLPNTGNYRTITDYLWNGDTTYFRREPEPILPQFQKAEEEWKKLRKSGKIRIIKPESNTLEELIEILNYFKEHLTEGIRAVFIDYIQELYLEDIKRIGSRPDELKKIMVEIDLFAQKANIPIIAAAQLARGIGGPGGLCNEIISDSGWIERKASEIVLIWSSNGEKGKDSKDTVQRLTEIVGSQYAEVFNKEEEGYLFLKLTKSRTIPKGAKAVVEIHGNSGRVQRNGDLPKPPQPTEVEMEYKEEEENPIQAPRNSRERIEEPQPEELLPFPYAPSEGDDEDLPF